MRHAWVCTLNVLLAGHLDTLTVISVDDNDDDHCDDDDDAVHAGAPKPDGCTVQNR